MSDNFFSLNLCATVLATLEILFTGFTQANSLLFENSPRQTSSSIPISSHLQKKSSNQGRRCYGGGRVAREACYWTVRDGASDGPRVLEPVWAPLAIIRLLLPFFLGFSFFFLPLPVSRRNKSFWTLPRLVGAPLRHRRRVHGGGASPVEPRSSAAAARHHSGVRSPAFGLQDVALRCRRGGYGVCGSKVSGSIPCALRRLAGSTDPGLGMGRVPGLG